MKTSYPLAVNLNEFPARSFNRGRPAKCASKLFFVAEEEMAQCEDETPGMGGFPAYDFYPLLAAFILASLYDCEPNAESIWRELNRNPSFAALCTFDAGDVPSPRTLRRFNRIMAERGLWEEVRRTAVAHNLEEGVIEDSGHLIVDVTHHDAFASIHKPVKTCRECKRIKTCKQVVHTCDVTDIVAKSPNFKLPGVKSVVLALAGSEIPIAGIAMNARMHDSKSLSGALETVVEGETGVFFDRQDADSLVAAVKAFRPEDFDPAVLRAHARRFDVAVFKQKIEQFVATEWERFREAGGKYRPAELQGVKAKQTSVDLLSRGAER